MHYTRLTCYIDVTYHTVININIYSVTTYRQRYASNAFLQEKIQAIIFNIVCIQIQCTIYIGYDKT